MAEELMDYGMGFDSRDMCDLRHAVKVIESHADIIRTDIVAKLKEEGSDGFIPSDVKGAALSMAQGIEELGMVLGHVPENVVEDERLFTMFCFQVISHFLHITSLGAVALTMYPQEMVDAAWKQMKINLEKQIVRDKSQIIVPGRNGRDGP